MKKKGTERNDEDNDEQAAVSKGIDMLRLDRKLKPILDAWREAKRRDPKAWA